MGADRLCTSRPPTGSRGVAFASSPASGEIGLLSTDQNALTRSRRQGSGNFSSPSPKNSSTPAYLPFQPEINPQCVGSRIPPLPTPVLSHSKLFPPGVSRLSAPSPFPPPLHHHYHHPSLDPLRVQHQHVLPPQTLLPVSTPRYPSFYILIEIPPLSSSELQSHAPSASHHIIAHHASRGRARALAHAAH